MKNLIMNFLLVIGFVLFNQLSASAQKTLPQPPSTTYNVYSGQNKVETDNVSITLKPGVHIQLGASFHAYITGTPPEVIPNAPSGLAANASSASQINLTWADNSNNETGFKLEWSLNASGPFTQILIGENITSYNHTGLNANTNYYYRVRAYNDTGNSGFSNVANAMTDALLSGKPRVIVLTDLGGGDNDDYQSLIHFLLYADEIDIKGFVSSPPFGQFNTFTEVWDAYESDFTNLITHSSDYPTRIELEGMTKKGYVIDGVGNQRIRNNTTYSFKDGPFEQYLPQPPSSGKSTTGSNWIKEEAKKPDSRPLYILGWGGLADIAQALFDLKAAGETTAINKIRLYSIGLWNREYDQKSYDYIDNNFKELWWIDNYTTYFGMFKSIDPLPGGESNSDYGSKGFLIENINNHGHLGDLYYAKSYASNNDGGTQQKIKEGDSPSFLYVLSSLVSNVGNLNSPTAPSWGGSFVASNKNGHTQNYWVDDENAPDSFINNWGNNPYVWNVPIIGSETVYDWRQEVFASFKTRMDRALVPKNGRVEGKAAPKSMKMIAYPNPSSGTVSIQSPIFKSKFNLRIVDKLNQNIHFKITERTGERIKIQIDGGEGEVYFIKVNTQGGAFVKKIFMKK